MAFRDTVEEFVRHGRYLRDWSERTVKTYRQGLSALHRALGEERCTALDRAALDAFVVDLRERGLTPGGCNMYVRTVNSFLSWLHEQGRLPSRLRVRLLPDPPKEMRGLSDAEARAILSFRPSRLSELRTWTLVLTLMDTGLRIEEAMTLRQDAVDMDNLLMRVTGKGRKQRLVPFSPELRKRLFALMARRPGTWVFSTRDGLRLTYRNTYRQLKAVCAAAGVEGPHVRPHAFRHLFAVTYLRRTNDVYRLSRILGHSSVSTTQLYLRSMTARQVAEGHVSPLVM